MKINIETIPHENQRYPTVGDYWDDGAQVEQIRVSEMPDWRYEALIAVHELIEMILTNHRGIAEQAITEFDIAFEKSREEGQVLGEPGDDPRAPYRSEHFFATNVERLLGGRAGSRLVRLRAPRGGNGSKEIAGAGEWITCAPAYSARLKCLNSKALMHYSD